MIQYLDVHNTYLYFYVSQIYSKSDIGMMVPRADGDPTFSNALSELKRRGCALLVSGYLPDDVLNEFSAKLLGKAPGQRARIITLLDRDIDVARERIRAAAPGIEPVIVIDTVESPRTTTVAQQIQNVNGELHVRTIERDLHVVEGAILEAISEIKTQHYPLDAAALRVSVDSLDALARCHDHDTVRQFVETVGTEVVDASGMAHFVYRAGSDSEAVRRLVPQFDAHVQHRIVGNTFMQRWYLPEYDIDTDWYELGTGE